MTTPDTDFTGFPHPFWTIPPDLAVEVVSPSNTRSDIREKVLE